MQTTAEPTPVPVSHRMEAMGFLATGIAHDINNLLAAIASYTESVQSHLPPNDPLRTDVSAILKVAAHGRVLTRQLLAFSKPHAEQPTDVNVGAMLEDLDTMLRWMAGPGVDLVASTDPDLLRVRIDPGQLEQILMNLCVNAADAMASPRGGTLRIELFNGELHNRPCVMLCVSDTGVGMDETTLAHAFEPFFTTKGEKGNGLGLATVRNVVQQVGGEIRVHSEPGRGTAFSIYLPAVADRAPATRAADAMSALLSTATVLVADDEELNRLMNRRTLARAGFTVLVACDGADAVSVAEAYDGPIDIVVTDVTMPGVPAVDMVRRLQRGRPELRVIYVSGHTDLVVDGAPVLSKPFTSDVLTRRVREELSTPNTKFCADRYSIVS